MTQPPVVLIAADLSHWAPAVLREGFRQARSAGAAPIVLHVIDDRFPYPDLYSLDHPDSNFFRTLRESALEHLRGWARNADAPANTEFLVSRGKPSAVILELAHERKPSLIVIGKHGLTERRHASHLGATVERVAREAPASMLIVVGPPE